MLTYLKPALSLAFRSARQMGWVTDAYLQDNRSEAMLACLPWLMKSGEAQSMAPLRSPWFDLGVLDVGNAWCLPEVEMAPAGSSSTRGGWRLYSAFGVMMGLD